MLAMETVQGLRNWRIQRRSSTVLWHVQSGCKRCGQPSCWNIVVQGTLYRIRCTEKVASLHSYAAFGRCVLCRFDVYGVNRRGADDQLNVPSVLESRIKTNTGVAVTNRGCVTRSDSLQNTSVGYLRVLVYGWASRAEGIASARMEREERHDGQ